MTLVFYAYFVAQEWINRANKSIVDWWQSRDDSRHKGADLSFAEELHGHQNLIDKTADVPLEEDAIEAKEDLVRALEAMERSTVVEFSRAVDVALEKFQAGHDLPAVTATGEVLMVKMEMTVWVNEQVDQIRSLGAEITEACRNS